MLRLGRSAAVTAPLLLLTLVAGCGSSSGHSAAVGTALQNACSDVAAVLSDGPDPDADPIGYAQAQVLPLRQIPTSDKALATAIDQLATAYQAIVSSKNSKAANALVTSATTAVNNICPGAGS